MAVTIQSNPRVILRDARAKTCGQFVDGIRSTTPICDGNEWEGMQKPSRFLVAATFEKTKTYVFAETQVRDREVGGSNPLAPTRIFSENPQKNLAADSRGQLLNPTNFVRKLA